MNTKVRMTIVYIFYFIALAVVVGLMILSQKGLKITKVERTKELVSISNHKRKFWDLREIKNFTYKAVDTSVGTIDLPSSVKRMLDEKLGNLEGRSYMMVFDNITVANGGMYKCLRTISHDGQEVAVEPIMKVIKVAERTLQPGDTGLMDYIRSRPLYCIVRD